MRQYRPDVDGLRAVAIIAVVAYHAGVPGVAGGYVGVDVFFVISGFLITQLLATEVETHGGVRFIDFYARRARRLIPAMTAMLLAVLILGRLFLSVLGEQQTLAKSAIATMLFSSNFYFLRSVAGYFAPVAAAQPLLHTWSLGVEEQFYFAWPVMVHLVARSSKGHEQRFEARLTATLITVFATSLGLGVWATAHHPGQAYYLMPPRAWEFAVGGLVALNARCFALIPTAMSSVVGLAGLFGVVLSATLFDERTHFPGIAALLPVMATAAIVAAGIAPSSQSIVMMFLSSRWMVYLGLISYSWYLWHWPLLVIARVTSLGGHNLARDVGLAMVSLILAIVTYEYVERPIRRRRSDVRVVPARILVAALFTSFAVVAVAIGIGWSAYRDMRTPRFWVLHEAKTERPPLRSACNAVGDVSALPLAVRCTAGDTSSSTRIVLWGDSHADHLMPLAALEASALSAAAIERSRSACPPLVGVTSIAVLVSSGDERGRNAAAQCAEFNTEVLRELRRREGAQHIVGVVVSARWPAYLGNDSPFDDNARFDLAGVDGRRLAASPIDVLTKSLAASVSALTRTGLRVLVVAPTPWLPFLGPDCLARRSTAACLVPRSEIDRLRAPALAAIKSVVDRFDNARLWDPIDDLCNVSSCGAMKDGIVVYLDDGHLTIAASRSLEARARPAFEWLVTGGTSLPPATIRATR